MVTLKLTKNNVFQWFHQQNIYAKGYLFSPGGTLYRDATLCSYFSGINDEKDFREKLLSANGTFSVIIQQAESLWMAVDRLRYFPLFYRKRNDGLIIGDEIETLYNPDELKKLDTDACLSFTGLSYVLGNKTLLKDIFQLQAGEYIVYENQQITPVFYHQCFSPIRPLGFDEAKEQLKSVLRNVGQRMVQLLGDRQVILSLSGGFDSRLLAYLLKKGGINNVLCYTYGKKDGNPEWKGSQAIAERLGFEWIFIDYTGIDEPDFYKQKRFIDFYKYASQYVSKFGVTEYFAADYLIDELKIPAGSVHLPGHGGDFFSGSHFRPYMQRNEAISLIARDLQYKHCDLVELNRKESEILCRYIQLELVNGFPYFANLENWELKERQAKYIFNSNRLWEQRGIDSLMPLCDIEFMDFFDALPFEYRLNQKLYKTVLTELFAEFDINFPQDIKQPEHAFMQELKVWVKRIFPFVRRKQDPYLYDYFDFRRLSKPVLDDLQKENHDRKILSFAGIYSEWYLMQVKKEII
jgi:asparagine synthase (glutamine-hydrolysing)